MKELAGEPADRRSEPQILRPPAIRPDAAAVLALQRTAGNQAVARFVRATRMLQRLPIEGVDPASEHFWGELAHAAETQLRAWLEDDFGPAIDQFVTDLLSAEEGGAADEFTLDTFMTLLAFLPEGGELAVGVLTVAKSVYDLLPLDSPIELAEFASRARRNKQRLGRQMVKHDRELELFRLLDEAKQREDTGETDLAAREAAATEITTTIAGLPSMDQYRRALSLDWIRSSKDSWDSGTEAGVIWAEVTYPNTALPGQTPQFRLTQAQIDDVSRPDGVITSLKDVYGADTPLELLPVEMVVQVNVATTDRGLRIVRFVNPPVNTRTDLRGAPSWTFLSGDEAFSELWDEQRLLPTVGELSAGRYRL
jgi:hypothetical protein